MPPFPVALDLGPAVLRPWRAEDAAVIVAYANDREVWINLRDAFPHPYTLADAEAYVRRMIAQTKPTGFAIEVDGQAVGSVGFKLGEDVERTGAEIGYWLGQPFWGRGIMTAVVAAASRWAIEAHDLTRIFAVPFAWNVASARVLEKAGFILEGRLRRSVIKDRTIVDQLLYAWVPEPT